MKKISNHDIVELQNLKDEAIDNLRVVQDRISHLAEEAQNYYDERSEKWQESENGEAYSEWISNIEYKASSIEDIITDIENIDIEEIKQP